MEVAETTMTILVPAVSATLNPVTEPVLIVPAAVPPGSAAIVINVGANGVNVLSGIADDHSWARKIIEAPAGTAVVTVKYAYMVLIVPMRGIEYAWLGNLNDDIAAIVIPVLVSPNATSEFVSDPPPPLVVTITALGPEAYGIIVVDPTDPADPVGPVLPVQQGPVYPVLPV